MDKIILNREEQIRWAARMQELRHRAIARYQAMVGSRFVTHASASEGAAYLCRVGKVGEIAWSWQKRWPYPDNHWNQ